MSTVSTSTKNKNYQTFMQSLFVLLRIFNCIMVPVENDISTSDFNMKIYIRRQTNYYYPTLYVLKLMEKNQSFRFDYVESVEDATLIWDHLNEKSQPVSLSFYDDLANKKTNLRHKIWFKTSPAIHNDKGQKDVIATIFYMINCLQEFNPKQDDLDQYGRFKFESSYQSRFNNIEENLVQKEIDLFFMEHELNGTTKESTIFISHDIDTIYGSFIQDGLWALKKMKPGLILKLIANELIRKPHWRNIDRILKINSEYDIRSTFFWLVNQGKGTRNIMNADYDLKKEKRLINMVSKAGSFNGLHKSCSEMSIDDELQKGDLETSLNRYHFLNFQTTKDWKLISESKLTLDCSLGFAEHYGFRNSYGKSFQPFDMDKNEPFSFIEAPLTVMDTTLRNYMKLPAEKIGDTIIDFYEKTKYNCVHSLLWHNTSFTDYKFGTQLSEYKKVISYFYENKIGITTPEEIIRDGRLNW